MNSIHSSRTIAVLMGLAVVATLALPAMAVTVEDQTVPNEGEVGARVSATYTLTDLYQDPDFERWTLVGETELENATWTIQFRDQTGSQVDQQQIDSQEIEVSDIAADRGIAEVEVRVTGNVPPIGAGNFTYPESNAFQVAKMDVFVSGGDSGDIGQWSATRYTADSRSAREELDQAQATIQDAEADGVDVESARSTFEAAQSAFRAGNFENAINLANQAEDEATTAQESAQSEGQLIQFVLIGLAIIVALAIVGGGFYMYRQRQQQDTKLR